MNADNPLETITAEGPEADGSIEPSVRVVVAVPVTVAVTKIETI